MAFFRPQQHFKAQLHLLQLRLQAVQAPHAVAVGFGIGLVG